MVRGKNMRELPAKFFQLFFNRISIWRVNRSCGSGHGVMNDHAIIIFKAHKLAHVDVSHLKNLV